MTGTTSYCLLATCNASGTGRPTDWHVTGNEFDAAVTIRDGVDIFADGNHYQAGVAHDFASVQYGGGARAVERNWFTVGAGHTP